MSYANLLTHTESGVHTITINRPDKLNALNQATIAELHAAFAAARAATDVRVVVAPWRAAHTTPSRVKSLGSDDSSPTCGPILAVRWTCRFSLMQKAVP